MTGEMFMQLTRGLLAMLGVVAVNALVVMVVLIITIPIVAGAGAVAVTVIGMFWHSAYSIGADVLSGLWQLL